MLEFMRNKRISVARKDPEIFTIQAELDDSIYSLELFLKVQVADLKCIEIMGNWRRWTTPECPRALDFLKQAEGFFLVPGIEDKIHKTIGRTSCRHFANLLIECARAAQHTQVMVKWEAARINEPDLSLGLFMERQGKTGGKGEADTSEPIPEVQAAESPKKTITPVSSGTESEKKETGNFPEKGFMVDLHIHTFPASACASDSAEDMVKSAREKGLDAICLTDHNHVWSEKDVGQLMDRLNFQIFRGNEIVTDQGDMLVFGFYDSVDRVIKLKDLSNLVKRAGGFIVAAHPFRGFLTFGAGQIGLTPEKAMEREMFNHVQAVETLNGKVTQKENELARKVAQGLNLSMTGGSDAHDCSNVGIYATCFENVFSTQEDFIAALHSGGFAPIIYRRSVNGN